MRTHVLEVKATQPSSRRPAIYPGRGVLLLTALFAATLAALPADAQFSGPALPLPSLAAAAQTPTNDPALLSSDLRDQVINPEDLIVIRIFGVTDYSPPVRVDADGNVQLPLIGPIHIGGMTIIAAEDLIAKQLNDAGMYNNPQVSLAVTETPARFVTVTGEMHAVLPVAGDHRLLEILAAAGNFPVTASHTVTILRPGLAEPIVVALGPNPLTSAQGNIVIKPRDTVVVSRVGVVYVLGAFKSQGAIPLQQNSPLTLLQLASLAGGAGFEGKYNDLRIIRTDGLTRKLVKVDYKRILNGQDPDPVLAADDIVFLPTDLLKGAIKSGGVNTLATVADLFLLIAQTNKGN